MSDRQTDRLGQLPVQDSRIELVNKENSVNKSNFGENMSWFSFSWWITLTSVKEVEAHMPAYNRTFKLSLDRSIFKTFDNSNFRSL